MECPDVETVQAYVSSSLPPVELEAVKAHVAACDSCYELISALEDTQGQPSSRRPPTLPPPAAEERLGSRVGRYLIERRLGAGAMGVVYAARDPGLDRGVALKLLKVDSEDRRARLVREAQALARISHPNVCSVYDIGASQGRVFVAMELIDGQTLASWLAARRRSVDEIRPVFAAAARGLHAAHLAGIIHRDFKPENVLVGHDGRVRVTDFGLAGWAAEPPSVESSDERRDVRLTQTGSVLGTPLYMSPEQMAGRPTDARSDQWSFTVALYEALLGRRPFTGKNLDELSKSAGRGLTELPAGIPRPLARLVRRGLQVDPAARHPSLGTIADILDGRRSLRLLLAAGAAAATAGALAFALARAPAPRPTCTGGEARLAGVWDAARRDEVKTAFARTGHPYAAASFESARARLDDYATAWAGGVAQACVAARVDGTETEARMAQRLACLDERLAGLRALAAALAAPDAATVARAPVAAERLESIAGCAGAINGEPPDDVAAAVATVRAQIATARALTLVAPWSATVDSARASVEAADKTGWAPVQAEARVALADVLLVSRAAARAEEVLYEAVRFAEEGRADRARAEAAVLLASAAATQGKKQDAARWGKTAEAVLARIGGDDALAVRLDTDRGDVASLERALERQIRARGERSLLAGEILYTLAVTHEQDGRTAQAQAARARADAIFAGLQEPGTGYAPLQVRETQEMMAGRFAEAVAAGEAALAIMERSTPGDHPILAEAYSTHAYALEAADRFEDALRARRRAIDILDRAGETTGLLPMVVFDTGSVLLKLGRPAEALTAFERAMSLTTGARPDDPLPALVLSGTGEAMVALGRAADALAPLESALTWREAHGDLVNPGQLGSTLFTLARAHRALGHERVALELGRRALAAYQAHQQKFAGALGWGKKAYAVATVHAGEVAAFLGEK